MKMLKLIAVFCVLYLSASGASLNSEDFGLVMARGREVLQRSAEAERGGDDEECCCNCWPLNASTSAESYARSESEANTHESGRSPAAAPAVAASHHGAGASREGHTVVHASANVEGKLIAFPRSGAGETAVGAEMLAVASQAGGSGVSGVVNRHGGVLGTSLVGRKSAAFGIETRTGVGVDAHSRVQDGDAAARYAAASGADDGVMPRDFPLPGEVLLAKEGGASSSPVTMAALRRREPSAGGAASDSVWSPRSFADGDVGKAWGSLEEELRALGVYFLDIDDKWSVTERSAEAATSAISASDGAGGAGGSAVATLSAPGILHRVPTEKLLIHPNYLNHYMMAYANLLHILNSQEIIKELDVDGWLAKQVHAISWLSLSEKVWLIEAVSSKVKTFWSRSSTTADTPIEQAPDILVASIKSALEADAATKRFMTPLSEGDKYYQPMLSLIMELIKAKAIPTGNLVEFIHAQVGALPTIEASRKAAFAEGIIKGICAIYKIPRKPAVGGGAG